MYKNKEEKGKAPEDRDEKSFNTMSFRLLKGWESKQPCSRSVADSP